MAAGHRSLLAVWMGGASAAPVTTSSGVRSMLAPWMGGASASVAVDPPAPPPQFSGGAVRRLFRDDQRLCEIEEEDSMLLMIGALAAQSWRVQ
jgi:hypothetical protein